MRKNRILALNSGSSSLKFQINQEKVVLFSGEFENIGSKTARILVRKLKPKTYLKKIKTIKEALCELQVICHERQIGEIHLISHRMVFGGAKYLKPTKITESVLKELANYQFVAPLHIPNEIEVVREAMIHYPRAIQVACFDTSFHANMPEVASHLPIPTSYYKKGIKKFGFHGLSYESVIKSLKLGKKKAVVAHLGSGASLSAIDCGKSIDTSMGLTPLGGIMMGSRPGDLDPGVLLYLLKQENMTFDDLESFLNYKCGFKGLTKTQDVKDLLENKDYRSKLAVDMFCYQVAKKIAEYLIALKRIDVIVFTGAIGYRSHLTRKRICKYLLPLGVQVGPEVKKTGYKSFSSKSSKIKLFAFETKEEDMLIQHALEFV